MDFTTTLFVLAIIPMLILTSNGSQHSGPRSHNIRTEQCDSELSAGTGEFDFDIGQFSHEHVNNTKESLQTALLDLLEIIRHEKDAWTRINGPLQFSNQGLLELNPRTDQTRVFTNVSPSRSGHFARHQHVILKEIRWFLTSIEVASQLAHHAGQLGPHSGSLVTLVNNVSHKFDYLVRGFGVHLGQLPEEANCRETNTITVDSVTIRIRFTSLVLRDMYNALARIYDVLSGCEVRGNHGVRHGLYMDCHDNSAFYSSLQYRIPIPLNYFVNHAAYECCDQQA